MSRKKHPEHVNHERWLVSYADFITLLFAFFVVLFAAGQTDKRKQVKLAEAMQTAFIHHGLFDPHSRTPPISDVSSLPQSAPPSPVILPLPSAPDLESEDEIIRRVHLAIQSKHPSTGKSGTSDTVSVSTSRDGLVISLREAGFFDSGSADIRPDALAVFTAVAAALPHQPMRVEGHTDDVPIHTPQFATNWELSTARAATVTRLLLAQHAVSPAQVSVAGYAEYRPQATNSTPEGRARNRRVDIILLTPAATPQTGAP